MKIHRYVIVLVVLLATVLLSGSVEFPAYNIRGSLLEQKYSLKGLKEIEVDVRGGYTLRRRSGIWLTIEENDANHLLARHVRRQVESRLVQNGLSVLPDQDIQERRPWFIVNIGKIEQSPGKWILDVKTQLRQEVMLKRDTNIRCSAITWQLTDIGLQGTDDLQGRVEAIVKTHLDAFIEDYLAMNPKQIPKDK